MSCKIINPLISAGGKYWAVPLYPTIIVDCAERHNLSTYIEGTGGGAKMLANIKRGVFRKRIYNEWDYDVCCYFAALADNKKTNLLISLIEDILQKMDHKKLFQTATRYSEVENCKNVEQLISAAFAYIRSMSSYCGNRKGFNNKNFKTLINKKGYLKLKDYNKVLQGITVTNTDCFNLIRMYNNKSDFFYFGDHPYWGTEVYGDKRDWSDDRYIEFIDLAKNTKMKMMVCDTQNPYYDELVLHHNWRKYFMKGKHNYFGGQEMPEHVWVNFDIQQELLQNDARRIA